MGAFVTVLDDLSSGRWSRLDGLAGRIQRIESDVTDPATIDAVFAEVKKQWGKIDFVVHAIAFAAKDAVLSEVDDKLTEKLGLLALTQAGSGALALRGPGGRHSAKATRLNFSMKVGVLPAAAKPFIAPSVASALPDALMLSALVADIGIPQDYDRAQQVLPQWLA